MRPDLVVTLALQHLKSCVTCRDVPLTCKKVVGRRFKAWRIFTRDRRQLMTIAGDDGTAQKIVAEVNRRARAA